MNDTMIMTADQIADVHRAPSAIAALADLAGSAIGLARRAGTPFELGGALGSALDEDVRAEVESVLDRLPAACAAALAEVPALRAFLDEARAEDERQRAREHARLSGFARVQRAALEAEEARRRGSAFPKDALAMITARLGIHCDVAALRRYLVDRRSRGFMPDSEGKELAQLIELTIGALDGKVEFTKDDTKRAVAVIANPLERAALDYLKRATGTLTEAR